MPIVAIDPHRGPTGPATVDTDNLRGGREATEHLISLGHRRIAHLRGRGDLESARLREQGYREALRAAGIEVDQTLIAEGGYRQPAAGDGAAALFDAADPPTAIFAANDLSAIETMRVAAERGLRVPDDVSIVASTMCRRPRPRLPRSPLCASRWRRWAARPSTCSCA